MSNEMFAKAKECKNAEELLTLAKESGYELSFEDAEKKLAQLHNEGELSENELDAVAGGACAETLDGKEGGRFKLDSGYCCPACKHQFAVLTEIEKRPLHGGPITWYHFECEECKHTFSMTAWSGTKVN